MNDNSVYDEVWSFPDHFFVYFFLMENNEHECFAYYFGRCIIAPAGKINTRICILWPDRVRSICCQATDGFSSAKCKREMEWKVNQTQIHISEMQNDLWMLHLIPHTCPCVSTYGKLEKNNVSPEQLARIHFISLSAIGRWTEKCHKTHHPPIEHRHHIITYYFSSARNSRTQ